MKHQESYPQKQQHTMRIQVTYDTQQLKLFMNIKYNK